MISLFIIGILELDWDAPPDKRLFHPPLDVILETEGESEITARIQVEEFEDMGTGIKVKRTDYGFLVHINNKAYWRICDTPLSGTRYNGSDKIHFIKE